MTWVTEWAEGSEFLTHRDGLSWFAAPVPRRRHACTPQTRGFFIGMLDGEVVERCACGAIRAGGDIWPVWMERNSRRRESPRQPWWRRMLGGGSS